MLIEVSKAEFKRLMLRELLEWPPFTLDGKVYGKRIESEDNPAGFVWCTA